MGKWSDRRSTHAEGYRHLYKTRRWQAVRASQLQAHPLCAMCEAKGRLTPATVCDHIDPKAKGDPERFFLGPFQSLCDSSRYRCHSSRKQIIEIRGYEPGCDAKGRPLDRSHPWNRG